MEKIKNICNEIEKYFEENYKACVELCGLDDEINTVPAKEVLDKIKILSSYIKNINV